MPIPPYISELREHIGTRLLWLPGATAYVVREHEGATQLLLVRRSDNGQWTPICGMTDPGEEPDVTAVREAFEEARVRIQVERLLAVQALSTTTYPNGDQAQYLDHAFRCRWVSGEASVGDDESTDVGWFALDELPELNDRFRSHLRLALDPGPHVLFGREGRTA
ncbi:NUDIX hydrolase [Luteipulveratus halotolerans]|uniref:DNA mismatch repair protein MutT n=1 Tax=Luteipulveratus halotolerans TaxID=1631356 RepID=A0A0L6CFE0_9MICO|nr:NUDIX domain-containing protein [Luteipulveratus halotolerans]KNX36248.1 DNA mismatch repair protein MutT [Luteipulveratus halotolerans]